MLFKRTCLLINYEDANRALDKAKPAKRSTVDDCSFLLTLYVPQSLLSYRCYVTRTTCVTLHSLRLWFNSRKSREKVKFCEVILYATNSPLNLSKDPSATLHPQSGMICLLIQGSPPPLIPLSAVSRLQTQVSSHSLPVLPRRLRFSVTYCWLCGPYKLLYYYYYYYYYVLCSWYACCYSVTESITSSLLHTLWLHSSLFVAGRVQVVRRNHVWELFRVGAPWGTVPCLMFYICWFC